MRGLDGPGVAEMEAGTGEVATEAGAGGVAMDVAGLGGMSKSEGAVVESSG